jgi:hypothetical protein
MKGLLIICLLALAATGYFVVSEWGKPSRTITYQPSAFDLLPRTGQ